MMNIFSYQVVTVTPMCGLKDHVTPELRAEHILEHVEHVPQGRGHPVVILFEEDHKHVEVAEVVFEPLDHGLYMICLVPEILRTTITSNDDMMTDQDLPDVLPKPRSVNNSELGV